MEGEMGGRWFVYSVVVFLLFMMKAVSAQSAVDIQIFRDEDSFTIYVGGTGSVSLQGLRMEVVDVRGNTVSHGLEEYVGFRGLHPFDSVPVPICLRLVRQDSRMPMPMDCNAAIVLEQQLADIDIFWIDPVIEQGVIVNLVGVTSREICPPHQFLCLFSFEPSGEAVPPPVIGGGTAMLGMENNPVTSNGQWMPYMQSFNGLDFMLVPAGCFMMGSAGGRQNEAPPGQQCFTQPFWIGRTEVSNSEYGAYGYWSLPEQPRERITWFQARAFCESRGARLPTEAEWEYAARGPDSLVFPWGNDFVPDNATYGHNAGQQTAFVIEKPGGLSWVGAYHMAGNVWEWTSTLEMPYPYYPDDGRENLADTTNKRVYRGGSWLNGEETLRSSWRSAEFPDFALNVLGVRCARTFLPGDLDVIAFNNRQMVTPTPELLLPMVYIQTGASLRSGPGTNYPRTGSAREGQTLSIIERTINEGGTWYAVRDLIDSEIKWIRADLVTLRGVTEDQITFASTTPTPP
jgi:formylglycine-generating enzyme required for sulfatase activity